MKLMTKDDLNEEGKYLRLLMYGEPGSGKTWCAAKAALDEHTAPALYVEYRAQITSLRSSPEFVDAINSGQLLILRLEAYSELSHVYTWLERGRGSYPTFDKMMEQFGHEDDVMPKTVILDSLTELQRTEVMRLAGNNLNKFLTEVANPEIKHWGSLLNQFTLLANKFYELPYHIVIVGLESVDYGDHAIGETPPIEGYRLALQGQAKRQFPGYALTLMRLERAARNSKAYNVGYTQGIKSKTKEQTGLIPAKIPNPSIPKLAKCLRGE